MSDDPYTRQRMIDIGDIITAMIPDNCGFFLTVFQHDADAIGNYMSTVSREEGIRMLREMANHLEQTISTTH